MPHYITSLLRYIIGAEIYYIIWANFSTEVYKVWVSIGFKLTLSVNLYSSCGRFLLHQLTFPPRSRVLVQTWKAPLLPPLLPTLTGLDRTNIFSLYINSFYSFLYFLLTITIVFAYISAFLFHVSMPLFFYICYVIYFHFLLVSITFITVYVSFYVYIPISSLLFTQSPIKLSCGWSISS